MGASASKQGRKLTKVVSENAPKTIHRTTNINQLPSENLKARYEKHIAEQSTPETPTIPEKVPNQDQPSYRSNAASFDAKFLQKKLKSNEPSSSVPEGRDGGDPHVEGTSTYEQGLVDSLTKLGKQIHTVEFNPLLDRNNRALQQLRTRKALYDLGEQEVKNQLGADKTVTDGKAPSGNLRTVVHPHTLTAIIKDLKDARVSKESIPLDYQLHPDFLKDLGDSFSVPTKTAKIEDVVKVDSGASLEEEPQVNTNESEVPIQSQPERHERLRKRISLDD
ncbi:uncharacterized protein J8A68_002404 [[Candida] subhashii]|uniref:Uncharacterized protein n=1 Tax=[Candida] subhashii TaxID=561895 RepID=A0A8J5QPC1_9ASCO|nr:uncharacterized protein J8A68_002404 [[Candida] subhashii]KAG7664080.1 hypothetical protein J8A68_002404 [[Candida] subhashii]